MPSPPSLPSPLEISPGPEEDSSEGRARPWASIALSYQQQMVFCTQQLAEINARLQLRTEPKMPGWYKAQALVIALLVLLRIFDAYAQYLTARLSAASVSSPRAIPTGAAHSP